MSSPPARDAVGDAAVGAVAGAAVDAAVDAAAGARVAVYRSSLLPASETFVLAQLLALRRWQPVLVGEVRVPGVALPARLHTLMLAASTPPLLRRVQRRWARWRGRPLARDVQALRSTGARLLHAHFGTDGVDVAPLAQALKLPLLITLHGFDVHVHAAHWQSGAGGSGMRSYPARLRALAQQPGVHFCAVSHDVARQALALGLPAARTRVLPIGVDVQAFQPGPLPHAQRPLQVLFAGRLVAKKGCRFLIDALAHPSLAPLQAELLLLGDGPLRATLQQQARLLGVRARFAGSATADQVRAQLASARVLCLPSITADNGDAEGFGLVLLEAQACGVPVVTSARGGRDDGLIDGVTGHAVAERNVPALAAALAAVLGDAARAQAMGQAARAFVVSRFALADCTAALEDHYDRIVAAPA